MSTFHNKQTIVWIHGITCNGDSHSFFNYENMKNFSKNFEIIYHPLLTTQYDLKSILNSTKNFDYLIFEGSFSKNRDLIERVGFSLNEIFNTLSSRVKHIICAGTCASFGGIFSLRDPVNITGAIFSGERKGGFWNQNKKIINIPGCPLHPRWLVDTLFMLKDGKRVALDELSRPKEVFSYFVHHGCLRNEYFEWKIDAKQFGEKEGCLFYEHGCKGPMTHANCNKILWNEVSSKTRAGSPCLGCTEPTFPTENIYETKKHMSLPMTPTGVSKRAYFTMTGIAKSFRIDRLEKRLIDDN
ncbi:MAG: hydrogenase [Sulfurospirillaceae bacterium]|nr:hydrogenase [Sulfurospirillaceae bacterium]